jgi:ABC-type multidrug transport system ATPase subunit
MTDPKDKEKRKKRPSGHKNVDPSGQHSSELATLDEYWLAPSRSRSVFDFQDISYVVGKGDGKKQILKDVSGCIEDGSMLAIMGPSGAGKTSLLKALSLSITSGKVYGSINLNGRKLNNQVFKEHCFLVEQYDHWPFLTCKETLTYAAELLLGPGDHLKVVENIIEKMGLQSCEDTKVGNDYMQGLSGGQKRRLSIAIALLKKPAVILLDEPTSGLDASAAVAIVGELRKLARNERLIVIMTIHQPSTKVYNNFDQVMLLSKGEQAFMGKAKEASPYFDSIGHPMEGMTNPADFLVDIVNADFTSDESVNIILEEWKLLQTTKRTTQKDRPNLDPMNDSFHELVSRQKSYSSELSTLFRRHAFMIGKDPFLYVGRCIALCITTTLFAATYWNARNRVQEQAYNLYYANVWHISLGSLNGVVAVFVLNSEFKSVLREVKNGMIHPLTYICAKSILVLPVMFLFAISAISLGVFGILKLQADYGIYLIIYAVSIYVFECAAEMFSVMGYNPLFGMLSFLGFWFTSFLFAGIFIPKDDLPAAVRWLYYCLPFGNSFSAFAYQGMIDEDWKSCKPSESTGPVCVDFDLYPDEEQPAMLVMDAVGRVLTVVSSEDDRLKQMGTLLGMALVAKVVYIGIILYKSSQATKLCKPPSVDETNIPVGSLSSVAST